MRLRGPVARRNRRTRGRQQSISWDYAYNPTFAPVTSADRITSAEAAGELEPLNPGAPDPYQAWTTTILVRPTLPNR